MRYIRCNANWCRRAGRMALVSLGLQRAKDSGEVGHLPGCIALESRRLRICNLRHGHLRVPHRTSS